MDATTTHVDVDRQPGAPLAFAEFVSLVAALMALTALGIDSMLPALPAIGTALGVVTDNDRQWVISAFIFGFAAGQIVHGPLADRFGRRPVLGSALVAYAVLNLLAALAGSFPLLLAARAASGLAIAASRVVTVALVRDCYSGRAMARVMSLAFIVFMAAPVLAPTMGQLVLLVAPWRYIFGVMALVSGGVALWFLARMPETLPAAGRRPLSLARLVAGWRTALTERMSIGYTLALGLMLGALYGFINSVQQMIYDVFDAPTLLTPVFACVAGTMALASFLNSRFVIRFGTRRISHGALLAMIVLAGTHLLVWRAGWETLWTFVGLHALTMGCFGLCSANFGAMAMERMGAIAGTASSVQGFVGTLGGAVMGAVIGQSFNGTPVPLLLGFLVNGVLALGLILLVERGRLFGD